MKTNNLDIPAGQYSPLGLAYIGDAVFELMARTLVMSGGNASVDRFHGQTRAIVNAAAQADMYRRVYDSLTADEQTIIKRGRNAGGNTKAKNASVSDYRHATGLEALFGYLYLQGNYDRLQEIFELCVDIMNKDNNPYCVKRGWAREETDSAVRPCNLE